MQFYFIPNNNRNMSKSKPAKISYKFMSHLKKLEARIYNMQNILGTIKKISGAMATSCLGFEHA
jgi:hypothetical protein